MGPISGFVRTKICDGAELDRVALVSVPCLSLLLVAFALGVVFANASRDELVRHEHPLLSAASWVVLLFSVLFFAPTATYLVLFNEAWSLSYWVTPQSLPAWFPALLGLAYAAAPLAGFLGAAPLARQGSKPELTALGFGAAALALVCVVVGLPRMIVSGTYRQFHQGFGLETLAGSPLGHAILWTVLVQAPVIVWTYSAMKGPLFHHTSGRFDRRSDSST